MHRAHSFRKVFNFIQSTYIYWVSITHIVCSKHYTKLVDFQWAAVKSQMNSGDVNISRIQTQREKNHPKHPCILPYNARRYRSWNIFSTKQLRAVPTATPEVRKKRRKKSITSNHIHTHARTSSTCDHQTGHIFFFFVPFTLSFSWLLSSRHIHLSSGAPLTVVTFSYSAALCT